MKLLLIDDDIRLAGLLSRYFESYQWSLLHAEKPSLAYEIICRQQPEAIILDIMLPQEDGFQVCRNIRKTSDIPIIMLTARGDLTDRVVGLEIGADDYLPKPFEPRELVARIQTILRRATRQLSIDSGANTSQLADSTGGKLVFKDLTIDPQRQTVTVSDSALTLTTSEFKLLLLFASQPGKVFSRDEIMHRLRGTEVELFSRAIDITVSRLRQKLKASSDQEFVKTVWGSGYCFTGERL